MRGQTGIHEIIRSQPGPRESDIIPNPSIRISTDLDPRQGEGGTDIAEESNAGLGHGEHRVLSGDAVFAVNGKSDSAPHDDPVPYAHLGNGILFLFPLSLHRDFVIELIFFVQKVGSGETASAVAVQFLLVGLGIGSVGIEIESHACLVDSLHVSSRAECFAFLIVGRPDGRLQC